MVKRTCAIFSIFIFAVSLACAYNFETNTQTTITYSANLTNISQMQDVDTAGVSDNQLLRYDSATGKWTAETISGIEDTNETTRFNNLVGNCSAGDFVFGISSTGAKVCLTPTGSIDTNASTACDSTEVLLGNGTCYNSTLFYDDTDTNVISNTLYNETQFENSGGKLSIILSWFSSYFNSLFSAKTTDDLAEGSSKLYDNQSWNKTFADGLYAGIEWDYNQTTASVNILNGSGLIKDWNSSGYIKDWNSTGLIKDWSGTGDNSSWNESYADSKYTNCSADGSCPGITYDSELNYPTNTLNLTNGNGYVTNSTMNNTVDWTNINGIPSGFADGIDNTSTGGTDWTEITSIPEGFADGIDNDTTYDGSDFRVQSWDNLTGIPHATPSGDDTTHFSLAGEIYDWVIGLAYATTEYVDSAIQSIGNWTADRANYYNKTQTDSAITTANTSMKSYVDGQIAGVSGGNSSWNESYADGLYYPIDNPSGFYNGSDFVITSYYTKAQIESFGYYNATDFSIADYSTTSQMNTAITNANTSLYNYAENTYLKSYSNLSEDDVESYIFDSDNTGNLGMNSYNITNVSQLTFCNGANCWRMYVNSSDYFIIEGI